MRYRQNHQYHPLLPRCRECSHQTFSRAPIEDPDDPDYDPFASPDWETVCGNRNFGPLGPVDKECALADEEIITEKCFKKTYQSFLPQLERYIEKTSVFPSIF